MLYLMQWELGANFPLPGTYILKISPFVENWKKNENSSS